MDRNYEAIAILAHTGAETATRSARLEFNDPDWNSLEEQARSEIIEAVLAIARHEECDLHRDDAYLTVFKNIVVAALNMYGGHGGLAIEELTDLGNYMVNEMGYDPAATPQLSIAGSAKFLLQQQKSDLQELSRDQSDDVSLRERALELAIGSVLKGSFDTAADDLVKRAKTFEQYLAGPFTDRKQGVYPPSVSIHNDPNIRLLGGDDLVLPAGETISATADVFQQASAEPADLTNSGVLDVPVAEDEEPKPETVQ